MLNRLLRSVALMLLTVASPAAAQPATSDRDLRNLPHSGGLFGDDLKRFDELKEEDARFAAAAAAEGELRAKLLRLPPLPVERNVLLGSWRQEGGGQQGALLGSQANTGAGIISELGSALLSNPETLLPSRCVYTFGKGVTFTPSTFSIRAFDGSTIGGRMAYRSAGKQGIWVLPDSIFKTTVIEVTGPNRIVLGGTCALVRVGAPAANAAASPTTAPGNALAAVSRPSSQPASSATRTAAVGPARRPIEPISRLGRGVQLHGEKDFQQALQQLLVAEQSDPNDPRVYVYLADTYGWLGMDAEAKQAAERAKQLDPNAFEILR